VHIRVLATKAFSGECQTGDGAKSVIDMALLTVPATVVLALVLDLAVLLAWVKGLFRKV
jgi:hypothetical protein